MVVAKTACSWCKWLTCPSVRPRLMAAIAPACHSNLKEVLPVTYGVTARGLPPKVLVELRAMEPSDGGRGRPAPASWGALLPALVFYLHSTRARGRMVTQMEVQKR